MTRQVAAASEPLAKTTDAATTEPVEEAQYKCSITPTSAAAAPPPPPPPRYTEFHQKRRTSKAETTNTNTTAATTCHRRLFHQSRRLRQANLEINNDTRFI